MIKTAMILAAGRGNRLRPLTDSLPKPLVQIAGKSLIQRHIEHLIAAGITRIVINVAYLAEKIVSAIDELALDNNIDIVFSHEPEGALETAGGIVRALPLLKADRFIVVNADIYTDFNFVTLTQRVNDTYLAHMVMVPVPAEKAEPDFCMQSRNGDQVLTLSGGSGATFSGVSVMSRDLFQGLNPEHMPLRPVLERAINKRLISAQMYDGFWCDVGTLNRLEALRQRVEC